MARCPAHDDKTPSLSITEADDRVLLHCHAGCITESVLSAVGLDWPDLYSNEYKDEPRPAAKPNIAAAQFTAKPAPPNSTTYIYREPTLPRRCRFVVFRKPDKTFLQAVLARDEQGKALRDRQKNHLFVYSLNGVERVLYRMPELLAAPKDRWVCIPEGEKDADTLAAHDFVATTAAGGASARWEPQYTEALRGRKVAIFVDNDDPGRKRGDQIAAALLGQAAEVRIVECPGVGEKGDVTDYIGLGHTAADVQALIDKAPAFIVPSNSPKDEQKDWPLPIPLDSFDRPPFPLEVLPPRMREMVRALAVAHQVDAALPAFLSLATLSTVVAKRRHVIIRAGWIEPINLWLLAPLPSANRKSPVLKEIVAPITQWQREEAERLRPESERVKNLRDVEERRLEAIKKELARGQQQGDDYYRLRGDLESITSALATDPALAVPVVPLLLMDDHTPESLAENMARNGGRMGILSAEGGPFDIMAGRHSKDGKTANLDIYLKGHAGEDVAIHRLSREAGSIEAAALTLGIAPQPEVVQALSSKPGFAGRGLLARCLYAYPISTVGHRVIAAPPVPEYVRTRWGDLLRPLLDLPDRDEPLTLSPDAEAALRAFEEWLEPRLAPDAGMLGQSNGWGGKLAGHVARIAGLFHLAENGANGLDEIQADTVRSAVQLARVFLIPHALATFDLMNQDPLMAKVRVALATIERLDAQTFSARELFRRLSNGNGSRFARMDDVNDALCILADRHYIRAIEPEDQSRGTGRKPSPTYAINPRIHENVPTIPTELPIRTANPDSVGIVSTNPAGAGTNQTVNQAPDRWADKDTA